MYRGNMHQVPMEPQKDKSELGDEITMEVSDGISDT